MPNWVYNGLTIEGNPDEVNKLVSQLNTSYTRHFEHNWNPVTNEQEPQDITYSNPVFSFWNIVKPTNLEAYVKQPDYTSDTPYAGDDWYSWNLRNWGTKWDVAVSDDDKYPDTYMEGPTANGDNLVVYYNFNTAWGIAEQSLTNLSSQYPTLLFTLSYEEETGWGGEHEYLRGEHLEGSEYNWKCRECDYEENGEPPYCEECEYDMCPSCGYGEPDENCQTHMVQSGTQVKENA
jgi:hypothetical protein